MAAGMLRGFCSSFVAIVAICTIVGDALAQAQPVTSTAGPRDLTYPKSREVVILVPPTPAVPRAPIKAADDSAQPASSTRPNPPAATGTSHATSAPGSAAPSMPRIELATDPPALSPTVAGQTDRIKLSNWVLPSPEPLGSGGQVIDGKQTVSASQQVGPLLPVAEIIANELPPLPISLPPAPVASAVAEGGLDEQQTAEHSPVAVLAEPYWVTEVLQRCASNEGGIVALDFEQSIWDALAHSPYVKAVQVVPMINQAKIAEASGMFDPTPFIDSIFNDNSDPVGNTLTTGGPSRLNEIRTDNGVGLRSKNRVGGSAELTQNMTFRDNNSVFLAPGQQSDTKMLLKMNQPLMRGAGKLYATSSVRIAELNTGVSQHEATRKLQLHAQSIANAYWNLFAARAIELQAKRGRDRLSALHDELVKRAELDGLESQLKRAEAAVARQNSSIARARADVIAASATLRALVNSPELSAADSSVLPCTPPLDQPFQVDRLSELQSALACHPDLLAARDRIKSAAIKLKVAENELRPTLDLVMEGYLRGLNGNYDLGNSLADQFSQGRPSYSGGLSYQRPYRNIIARSILKQRRLEMRQLLLDLDNTMLIVTADVDQAIATVEATYAELDAAVKSTLAFDEEVRYREGRWQNSFVESTVSSLLLDELLNAQTQLIQAENAWAHAQAQHMIAFARLHVATGSLLNSAPLPRLEASGAP